MPCNNNAVVLHCNALYAPRSQTVQRFWAKCTENGNSFPYISAFFGCNLKFHPQVKFPLTF